MSANNILIYVAREKVLLGLFSIYLHTDHTNWFHSFISDHKRTRIKELHGSSTLREVNRNQVSSGMEYVSPAEHENVLPCENGHHIDCILLPFISLIPYCCI
jgi:hypothetical protein